jgi:hypothetical protein
MEYNNENWKDVEGYEGFYKVSNLGRVRSLDRVSPTKLGAIKHTKGKIMNLTLKNNGYLSVMFSVLNKRKRFHVHRLVSIAFLDNEECKPTVNHINGIKTDNRLENLEWCTYSENSIHARDTGLSSIGEESTSAKLSENKILAIRRLFKINPKSSQIKICEKLDISSTHMSRIVNGKRWKHIL